MLSIDYLIKELETKIEELEDQRMHDWSEMATEAELEHYGEKIDSLERKLKHLKDRKASIETEISQLEPASNSEESST